MQAGRQESRQAGRQAGKQAGRRAGTSQPMPAQLQRRCKKPKSWEGVAKKHTPTLKAQPVSAAGHATQNGGGTPILIVSRYSVYLTTKKYVS